MLYEYQGCPHPLSFINCVPHVCCSTQRYLGAVGRGASSGPEPRPQPLSFTTFPQALGSSISTPDMPPDIGQSPMDESQGLR
jgi:hypothetical protein